MNYADSSYLVSNPTWHAEDSAWKASQCFAMLQRHEISPSTIIEVGCGTGGVIKELSDYFPTSMCKGYDISPEAIRLATENTSNRLSFSVAEPVEYADLLIAMDVFEHVRDYMGFLDKCAKRARFKLYHIPLDVNVSSVLRDSFMTPRKQVGHLHYFTASTALATLKDTGHEVIDYFYTNGALDLYRPSLKSSFAYLPRWFTGKFSVPLSAKLFGGYSLMVLTN